VDVSRRGASASPVGRFQEPGGDGLSGERELLLLKGRPRCEKDAKA